MRDSRWSECEGENSDVVFLAEDLSRLRYLFRRFRTDAGGTVEAKEFAGAVASLNDSVGNERDGIVWCQIEDELLVTIGALFEGKGQAGRDRELFTAQIWGEVAGVGESYLTIGGEIGA
jgi:hypothetical protein